MAYRKTANGMALGKHAAEEVHCRVRVNRTGVDAMNIKTGYNLSRAAETLIETGTLLETYGHTTLSTMSDEVLYTLNIVRIDKSRPSMDSIDFEIIPYPLNKLDENFSFLNLKNRDEGIANNNIIDPDIDSLSPELIIAKDKFVDPCDPFYEQDDEPTEHEKHAKERNRQRRKQVLITLADDLCMYHMSNLKTKGFGKKGAVHMKKNKYLNDRTTRLRRRK